MNIALDTSVIVSALCAANADHQRSCGLLAEGRPLIWQHAMSEIFSTLTGGRLGFRVGTSEVATILRHQIASRLRVVALDSDELYQAFDQAETRGIRGGAIHDYLHLVAARKAGAVRIYTLNRSDFMAFHRPGDPEIATP